MSEPFEYYPEDFRLTTYPLFRPKLFEWYQDAYKSYWTVDEISTSADVIHYQTRLSPGMQHFVKYVLAFFAASDGIVNMNLAQRFKKDVKMLEAGYFYDFQIMMENVHAHTYSILLDAIIPSMEEKATLFDAIKTIPAVTKMSEFMFECIGSAAPFAERLLMMACVEGIFFTGCFCAIYWLAGQGLMPALAQSNESIARDEALHTLFALYLYTLMKPDHKLGRGKIIEIIERAVNLAREFIRAALPERLPAMNADLMIAYIESQADNLVSFIDEPPIYKTVHEFHFMEKQNLINRTNFFERRVSEYSKVTSADTSEFGRRTDY